MESITLKTPVTNEVLGQRVLELFFSLSPRCGLSTVTLPFRQLAKHPITLICPPGGGFVWNRVPKYFVMWCN
jgi:hypothetical protein